MSVDESLRDKVHNKVKLLFEESPVPGHGLDHAENVARLSKELAEAEQARSPLLCEIAGLLHDIGRVPEYTGSGNGLRHHELSYEMLRKWYHEDQLFEALTTEEKIELLYAVRYHWNDEADEYDTAWILRDADKLDCLGEVGLQRMHDCFGSNQEKIGQHLRNVYQMLACVHTTTAKRLIEERKLVEPVDNFRRDFMCQFIRPISL